MLPDQYSPSYFLQHFCGKMRCDVNLQRRYSVRNDVTRALRHPSCMAKRQFATKSSITPRNAPVRTALLAPSTARNAALPDQYCSAGHYYVVHVRYVCFFIIEVPITRADSSQKECCCSAAIRADSLFYGETEKRPLYSSFLIECISSAMAMLWIVPLVTHRTSIAEVCTFQTA